MHWLVSRTDSIYIIAFPSLLRSSRPQVLRLVLDDRDPKTYTRPGGFSKATTACARPQLQTNCDTSAQLLIAVHIWTAKAIYDVLGRFGWFYGDFFIQGEGAPLQLYYTGIYRHVNNPERSGCCVLVALYLGG